MAIPSTWSTCSAEKQPYISEVFIDWDPTNFKEYFAIELYTPYAARFHSPA